MTFMKQEKEEDVNMKITTFTSHISNVELKYTTLLLPAALASRSITRYSSHSL